MRAGGDDERPRPATQRPRHIGDQRPVVVDPDRLSRKSQRRKEIQQVRPAGILDDHPVAGAQVRAERPLDAVQRPAGHREMFGGNTVGGQRCAGVIDQFGRHRRLPVQQRCAGDGLREAGVRDGQQRRVRVAGRQIARPRGHVEPEQRPGCGCRPVPHPGAAPPGGFDGAAIAQQAVGRGDGVGVHPEPAGQFADRWQRVAGRQRAPGDRLFDVGRYRLRTRTRYRVLYWHADNYVLEQ